MRESRGRARAHADRTQRYVASALCALLGACGASKTEPATTHREHASSSAESERAKSAMPNTAEPASAEPASAEPATDTDVQKALEYDPADPLADQVLEQRAISLVVRRHGGDSLLEVPSKDLPA
jgi:hypothetical protein